MSTCPLRLAPLVALAAVILTLTLPAYTQQPSGIPPLITQSIDETQRTVLHGNTHPLARPQYDRGPAPPDLPMKRMMLVLKRSPKQEAALLSLLDDQQDKASSSYHKWLKPEDFGKQFGLADEDIQTVTKWLRSHGFEIGHVAKGKNIIEFSGNASQVQEAFHTAIHKYVVNGKEHWANANDPEIPSALTAAVAGVHTLHNFLKQPMMHVAEQKIQAQLVTGKDGKPHVTFPGNPPLHALGPADYATIYNISPLYGKTPPINGTNQTIAIVGRSNFSIQFDDVDQFFGIFDVINASYHVTLNGNDPGDLGGGEEEEATLDVSWSAVLAPGALVNFVVSATTNTTDGVDLSESYIIDNNLADVMSESFGSCEASQTSTAAQTDANLAEQAAAQGITYLVASGDSGAEGCDDPDIETVASGPLSVNILAATPFNLAVGGTMFNEDGEDSKYWSSTNTSETLGSALSYIPEDVWNESCLAAQCGDDAGIWAGGGGVSSFFNKPGWQSGVAGIPNDGQRDVPDVSLTAAGHDPYLLCIEDSCTPDAQGFISFAAVGGTSASTPAFAAVMALVDQKMNARQGQAGYVLYKLAAAEKLSSCNASNTSGLPASNCVFNDVTVGNNAVPGEVNYGKPTAQYQSGTGYDLASGLGSVNVANLVNQWNTVTFTPTTTTLSLSPLTITHGQTVNVTATVVPNSGMGVPTGDISLVTSSKQALGFFTLSGGSVSSTINNLPGGHYTVTASYGGDGTFAPSSSAPTPSLSVSEEGSITTVSAYTLNSRFSFVPFTGGPYGGFVYLRADIVGRSGNGTPTGTAMFNDNGNSLSDIPFSLNSQGNTSTPNFLNSPIGGTPAGLFTLSPGAHALTATYFGDMSFLASNSTPVNVTITQASTTAVLTAVGANKGANLTATVNTSSGGNAPSGTVTFFVNGSPTGSPVTVTAEPAFVSLAGTLQGAQATASFNDTALTNGTAYTLKATYSGDANYVASTAPSIQFTPQADFLLTESENELDIASPGMSSNMTLTFAALDGFSGTIGLSASSCSGLPAGAACAFSKAQVSGGGTTTLTVSTTAASKSQLHHGAPLNLLASITAVGLAGFLWLGVPAHKRRSAAMLAVVFCAIAISNVSCGGGGGSSGTGSGGTTPPPPPTPTPAGIYKVVVTAASGSLKHSVSFTLNVE